MTRASATRRSAFALLAIIASFAVTVPVSAIPPDTLHFVVPYEFVVPAAENPCGVDILVAGEAKVIDRLFFNKNGDITKITVHVNDKWTESGLPSGGTVNASASRMYIETNYQEFDDGSFSITSQWVGMPVKLQLPGLGVIAVDAGNLAVNQVISADGELLELEVLWEHGQHPLFFDSPDASDEWIEPYCAIIAG